METVYLIVDEVTGLIVNRVVWDGDESKWTPPTGTIAVREE